MAFVGSDWNAYIELVFDLEAHPPYALGNRYEHLALEVDGDMKGTIEIACVRASVKILTEPKKNRPAAARWISVYRRSQRHSGRVAGAANRGL